MHASGPAGTAPPDWLFEVLGDGASEPARLRWGFTNESWTAVVRGRRLVATRLADPGSARRILEDGPTLGRRLAAVGVPTAMPLVAASSIGLGVVVFELIDGTPGIELIDRAGGAALLGRLAGRTWSRMCSADPAGLGLDDLWSRPDDLLADANSWLDAAAPDLPGAATAALRAGLVRLAPALARRPAGLVHGDFVPVNILVRDDQAVALLDWEAVRIGEPLLDAAWFEWILRYHHPAIADQASAAFAEAAGIDRADDATATLLAILPAVRILEILGRAESPAASRRRWLEQLRHLARATGRNPPLG
jgi:Ser/Thr protein kinase RdoA (MazF antagonist)